MTPAGWVDLGLQMVSHVEIGQQHQVNILQDILDNYRCNPFILQLFQLFPVKFTVASILTEKISTNPSTQFSSGFLLLDCHFY